MCKPKNLNIILMHSQAFKEGKAGRGRDPRCCVPMQLCSAKVSKWGSPGSETSMVQGLKAGMVKSQDTEALGMTLL